MPTEPLIALTGATGEVGSRVLALLGLRPLRLVVRDRARAPDVGADVRVASDYGDVPAMRAALEGVDTLLLIPAAEAPDRVARHLGAVDAAVAAGVRRIVYLSFVGASPDAVFTLVRDHYATEQRIRAAGVAFTFLRMNLYMDFIPGMAGSDGVIRGPAGDGRVGAVLRDDVAAAAAAVLTGSGHDGATYDITGREAFTLAEAAALLGVRYHDETLEEAYASRRVYGAPDWEVEGWVTTYVAIARGELATVSDDVRRLTGREPRTLAEYVA